MISLVFPSILPLSFASPHQDILIPPPNHSTKSPSYFPDVTVYGYLPFWTTDVEDIDLSGLSHIAYFSVDLTSSGSLTDTNRWHNNAATLISRAHAQGVAVHLCMTSFSDSVNNSVLPSASKRATTISELADLVNQYGADGINIDIEGMDAAQRENLNLFIQELAQEIPEIVIATPAVDWSDAYDYGTLSQYASLFIMGYGYHWSGSDPGPVDPLYGGSPWSNISLEYSTDDHLDAAPADRIILGLPLYGRIWPTVDDSIPGTATGTGDSIVMYDANEIATIDGWDYEPASHSPYILYPNEQIWYPNVESVRERVQYTIDRNIQGVGFWALGYENGVDGFWEMMQDETDFETSEPSSEPSDEPSNEPSEETSNQAPIADAGLDKTVNQGDLVRLDGSYSYDPDQHPISFQWVISDPEIVLDATNVAQPTFNASKSGSISFDLIVSDGLDQDIDSVIITVLEAETEEEEETKPQSCQTVSTNPFYALFLLLLAPFAFFTRSR